MYITVRIIGKRLERNKHIKYTVLISLNKLNRKILIFIPYFLILWVFFITETFQLFYYFTLSSRPNELIKSRRVEQAQKVISPETRPIHLLRDPGADGIMLIKMTCKSRKPVQSTWVFLTPLTRVGSVIRTYSRGKCHRRRCSLDRSGQPLEQST